MNHKYRRRAAMIAAAFLVQSAAGLMGVAFFPFLPWGGSIVSAKTVDLSKEEADVRRAEQELMVAQQHLIQAQQALIAKQRQALAAYEGRPYPQAAVRPTAAVPVVHTVPAAAPGAAALRASVPAEAAANRADMNRIIRKAAPVIRPVELPDDEKKTLQPLRLPKAVTQQAIPTRTAKKQVNLQRQGDESIFSEKTYQDMQHLVDLGLVTLPVGCRDVRSSHFTRAQMTLLTLQAIKRLGIDRHDDMNDLLDTQRPGVAETLYLCDVFHQDLVNKGMIEDTKILTDLSPSSEASDEKKDEERKLKISGEIRYNDVRHSGNKRWDWNDRRLRERIFLEGRINDNWHAFGMLEGNQYFSDHEGHDNTFKGERFYVRGLIGSALLTAGKYGYILGDGNIFDSTIRGATVDWGYPLRFEGTVAKTKPNGDLASLGAKKANGNGTYGLGIHHFGENDWGDKARTIRELYYTYIFNDNLSANAMYLGTDLSDPQGRKNGFVFKLQDGHVKSWRLGTHEWDLRYYYQPEGTYMAHTMNGLAGYMKGFKGWSLIYQHTILMNTVLNIEYYRLHELTTGDAGNTLWADMTYYF